MADDLRRTADDIGRTALFRFVHMWRVKFGRKLRKHSEIVAWLCATYGMDASDAEDLSLNVVAELLEQMSMPTNIRLTAAERDIVDCLSPGECLSAKEVAAKAGYCLDTVKALLRPDKPLRRFSYIVKGRQGYCRGNTELYGH